MKTEKKTLGEVFPGAFSLDEAASLRELEVVSLVGDRDQKTLSVTLAGSPEVTEEKKDLTAAFLDVYFDGQFKVQVLTEKKTQLKSLGFETMTGEDKKKTIINLLKKKEPAISVVLNRCSFDFDAQKLTVFCDKINFLLLKNKNLEELISSVLPENTLEEILLEVSEEVTAEAPVADEAFIPAADLYPPEEEPLIPAGAEIFPTGAESIQSDTGQIPPNADFAPAAESANADSEDEDSPEESEKKKAARKNRVMTGKPINTKDEIPLSMCDVERKSVVTRGIISQISIREIQNHKGILNIRLTDYFSTLQVKAFVVMKNYHEKMEKQMLKGRTILVKGSLMMDSYAQDLVLTAGSITLCKDDLVIDEEKKKQQERMILGRPFFGDAIPIKEALRDLPDGRVILQGDIIKAEGKDLRNDRTVMTIDITDYTDAISVKAYFDNEELDKKAGDLKKGKQIRVIGRVALDERFTHEIQMTADAIEPGTAKLKKERVDTAERKRVELHVHTKISEMDAVTAPKDLVQQAMKWGHPAIAITDHGVVQGFPEAMDAARKSGYKVIYGVEAYVVDDLRTAVIREAGQNFMDRFVVFDIETTGFDKEEDRILEIGAVKIEQGKIMDRFSRFVDPQIPIPEHITKLTSITDEMVKGQGTIEEVLPAFMEWTGDAVLVAHNASFDTGFIANKLQKLGKGSLENTIVDTLELARGLYDLRRYTLDSVARAVGVSLENHHRAVDDAEATAGIFLKSIEKLKEAGILELGEVNAYIHAHTDVKRLRAHHAIILVQSQKGLRNLYELVSLSHLKYFYRQPRIPKSEILKLREGLILGTACSEGELYEAVLENDDADTLETLISFYDYLEIQPVCNNAYLIADPDHGNVTSEEDLRKINRRIVELGDLYHKPVVATCDVHFKEPEDGIFRQILLASKDFQDYDKQPPMYFRTTDEMLEEFAYLGPEKAMEVVVDNTNKIADRIESILPIPDGQFAPEIKGADEELKRVCYEKAESMYGSPLPAIVQERLDHELDCIIRNGFATLYILARRLVLHSVGDGYYVGSRGSVGSSLAATMSGITEINPLKAHYYCKKCHFSDFDPPEARSIAGLSGFDLPDRNCPVCGTPLTKDGQEIPFEVFLGFDGDKEPDIDLNFSGEYQPRAHAYVEEMFGKDHVFRAGTMGGLAEKTAYGMVRHYLEEKGLNRSNAQINYLISGCLDVKRTTGQHPGGQIIVPEGYSVYDFTPVQHPANDMTTEIITTHYDYDQLHGRLLKLDILGHDDPTMIRMLEDMTGTVATEVPLDDPGVMSLFLSTEALGVTPEEIGTPVGTYGVSEFGTHFVRQMLVDTKPQNFSDLVRISGLSHGTNVWNNNAKDIVSQNIASISDCICTREDIMINLIHLGMDKLESFKIMEKVRKGKKSGGLSPTDIEHMVAHGIQPWYLDSCKKIQYLFPKAHAAAYVTMSLRIAYYKVHYKEYYYAAFFTIRADSFDYEKMALGLETARKEKEALEQKPQSESTAKDKEIHTLLELIVEFYCRGLEFLPMSIERSDSHKFQVIDGKLLPPFDTISGMGQTAAQSLVDARKEGEFLTIEDMLQRTKISRTLAEAMKRLGVLGDMPETDQMSLF